MSQGFSHAMTKSHSLSLISTDTGLLAPERWNVEKTRQQLDNQLSSFHDKQLNLCKRIRTTSNKSAVDLFEKILSKMRWCHPSISLIQQEHVVAYCRHLLGENPEQPFRDLKVLNAWCKNSIGTDLEHIALEVQSLYNKIKKIVLNRDTTITNTKSILLSESHTMVVKKEGKLRWMMETNLGLRDRYWTVWYLTTRGMSKEIERFFENPINLRTINDRDPDHGLTALHYACKKGNTAMFQLLLRYGADVTIIAPDGRTMLHIAAAYANREIVVELLGLSLDFFARDNFGCLAIDLANQNKNMATFKVLDNWNKLLPPEEEEVLPPEEDLTAIPDEYLATPSDVFERMSHTLKTQTRRLDGEHKHSFAMNMDPYVEMRICEKHSVLCFKEGFVFDGLKSLRRRWRVAKGLAALGQAWDEQQRIARRQEEEQIIANEQMLLLDDTSVDFKYVLAESCNDKCDTEAQSQSQLNGVFTFAPDYLLDSQSQLNVNTETDVEDHNQCREAVEQQQAVVENQQHKTEEQHLSEDTHEPAASDEIIALDSYNATSAVIDGEIEVAPAQLPPSNPYSASFGPNSVVDIGFGLSELYIQHKCEGYANTLLAECSEMQGMETHTRVAVLARRVEVMLCIHDLLNKSHSCRDNCETIFKRLRCTAPPRVEIEVEAEVVPAKTSRVLLTASAMDATDFRHMMPSTAMDMDIIDNKLKLPAIPAAKAHAPADVSKSVYSGYDGDDCMGPHRAVADMHLRQHESHMDAMGMNYIGYGKPGQFDNFPMSVDTEHHNQSEAMLPHNSSIAATQEEVLQSKRMEILQVCLICAQEAIHLHDQLFRRDVVEPCTLAPLLQLLAETHERTGQVLTAHECMSRAEVVSKRTLGRAHPETVRITVQVLRLQIKAATREGYKNATKKATELSRQLDTLAQTNQSAADRLSKKCAELIALSRLLEESQLDLIRDRKQLQKDEAAKYSPHRPMSDGGKALKHKRKKAAPKGIVMDELLNCASILKNDSCFAPELASPSLYAQYDDIRRRSAHQLQQFELDNGDGDDDDMDLLHAARQGSAPALATTTTSDFYVNCGAKLAMQQAALHLSLQASAQRFTTVDTTGRAPQLASTIHSNDAPAMNFSSVSSSLSNVNHSCVFPAICPTATSQLHLEEEDEPIKWYL